ncbi:protein kinase [Trypanosoma theileri]|uniref:Protein kinase n=1 Tax=Trypanosoma theileri TaxID=67003 RepID=A0A1X0NNI0_9TRYP|nr:protein kinase [Trypanosoma theileri]ORC86272.1 protein kinase [Trypanosoma theileri]
MESVEAAGQLEQRNSSTDIIIEELKELAKSMLETTEAVRRRTHNGEGVKSYQALLNSLESSAVVSKQNVDIKVHSNYHDPIHGFSLSGKPEKEFISSIDALGYPIPGGYHETKRSSMEQSPSCNVDLENIEETFTEDGVESYDNNAVLAENVFNLQQEKVISNNHIPTVDCSADSDDNIYDGVKTQVVFKAVDPVLYQEISSCTWQPEPLRLRVDTGETVEDSSEEEEADDDGVEGGANYEIKKVFRVPSFPFGGGVGDEEARLLGKMFSDTIRRGGLSASIKPLHITKKQLVNYEYEESFTTKEQRFSFKPTSPFEFVVELERDAVFDAVRAREERRREFRRLAKEGKAPVTMGSFNLRVIMDPLKTGFEEEKNFPIERGTIVADRYQIIELLGKATFSRAVRCYDLHQPIYDDDNDDENENTSMANTTNKNDVEGNESNTTEKKKKKIAGYAEVCLKIINNSKDFFDQSLDEIRLLNLINKYKDPDKAHVIRLIDSFYYKEHTMLVTELLSDNLYEYSKYNREEEDTFYFTISRLRRIARQITEALTYVHSLNLIHADLKPENILFVSHRRCIVKVIDFGSSCFLSDHLSSYIQSRSYRAPEVILGCDYDGRIDVWSLGAILVELVTGEVLFTSETVPEMLARIVYVCGEPLPRRMLWEGRHTAKFINKFGCIYEQGNKDGDDAGEDSSYYYLYTPVMQTMDAKRTEEKNTENNEKICNGEEKTKESPDEGPYSVLRKKLAAHNVTDPAFISFVEACLTLDHKKRPRSKDLLSHPFLAESD